MRTDFTVSRIKDSPLSYTVLLRTAGLGAVDASLWLNDAEARELGRKLLAATEPTIPSTTTPDAAA